jgi:hypothetical protein
MEWNCVEGEEAGRQETGVAGVRSSMFCKFYSSEFDPEKLNFEGFH